MAPDQQRTVSACQQHSRKVMLLGAARTGCGVLRPSSRLLSSPGALCKRSPSQRHFSAVSSVGNLRVLLPRRAMNCKATAVLLHQYHGLAGMAPGSGAVVLRGAMRSLSSAPTGARAVTRGSAGGGGSSRRRNLKDSNRKVAIYMTAVVAGVLGVSYAAVPLYKVFCQVTGFGGTTQIADADKATKMKPVEGGRLVRVTFDATCSDTMPWQFRPTQADVKVVPGETALAFFTAKNPTQKHITGVATYNVFPAKIGIYFNKIQCFCFEEQRLRAGEEIDMPVFFFLDPEMMDDPAMDNVNNVTLSYTFFQTAEETPLDDEDEEEVKEDKQHYEGIVGRTVGSLAVAR